MSKKHAIFLVVLHVRDTEYDMQFLFYPCNLKGSIVRKMFTEGLQKQNTGHRSVMKIPQLPPGFSMSVLILFQRS